MKYLLILGIIALAWCPWLSVEEAQIIVDREVANAQEKNPNLCALFIRKDSIRKIPFGYTEQVSYDCSVNDPVYGVRESSNVVFLTFYKGIFGIPNKTIKRSP